MWYSIKKLNYNFEIKKLYDTDEPIEAWFTKVFNCGLEESEIEINKQVGDNLEITLPQCTTCNEVDEAYGLYNLHIKIGEKFYHKITFPYYPHILKSLVKDLEKVFCGCPCPTCEDCIEKDELLDVTFKTIFYYSLSGNYYQQTFGNALKCIDCDLSNEAICLLLNEKIYGRKFNKRFLKRLLAIFYLTFYYTENRLNCDKEFVNNLFNIKKIQSCLENLGINLNCIKRQIYNKEVQTGDSYVFIENENQVVISKDYFLQTSPIYFDSDGSLIKSIEIVSVNIGRNKLLYNGSDVTPGLIIPFEDIILGKLIFILEFIEDDDNSFTWKIKEQGC